MLQCVLMTDWTVTSLEELNEVAKTVLDICQTDVTSNAAVLALHGDLGAGKTTFVQQMAGLLGVSETVSSPTFVIMKSYEVDGLLEKLVHIDAYRIESIDEMRVLGFEEILAQKNTIICIEWAERIVELLPANTRHLTFDMIKETRKLTLTP